MDASLSLDPLRVGGKRPLNQEMNTMKFWLFCAVVAVLFGAMPLMSFVMAWVVPAACCFGGGFLFLRYLTNPDPSA